MKTNYTDITFILDRSGSMARIYSDTVGGYNSFLKDQKEADGEAKVTLIQFDDFYEVSYSGVDVQDAPELIFSPRGSTALLDAIGRGILETGKRLDALPDHEKPSTVLFVIITDGDENASKEFTKATINEMIKHQTDVYSWDFVFLGANQDAIATGVSLGIAPGMSLGYQAQGGFAQDAFISVSANTTLLRGGDLTKKTAYFTDEDRSKQVK